MFWKLIKTPYFLFVAFSALVLMTGILGGSIWDFPGGIWQFFFTYILFLIPIAVHYRNKKARIDKYIPPVDISNNKAHINKYTPPASNDPGVEIQSPNASSSDIFILDGEIIHMSSAGNEGNSGNAIGSGMDMESVFTQTMPKMQPNTARSIVCPKCNATNSTGAKFCVNCGSGLATAFKKATKRSITCDKCGFNIPAGSKFCPNCADPVNGCPACGEANSSNAKKCRRCGTPMLTRCPSCGATVIRGSKFCPECGKRF